MKRVLWAAAHEITQEQRDSLGDVEIVHLREVYPELSSRLTNLQLNDSRHELARQLVQVSVQKGIDIIYQPAGDPAFQFALGQLNERVSVKYAYSKRVSVDTPQPDGSVLKTSVFKHEGWV